AASASWGQRGGQDLAGQSWKVAAGCHAGTASAATPAAGLASSSSGLCAFAVAVARLYGGIVGGDGGRFGQLRRRAPSLAQAGGGARLGSGSANCRLVCSPACATKWSRPASDTGRRGQLTASQLASAGHWDLRVLVCVVGAGAKSAPSTQQWRGAVATSSLGFRPGLSWPARQGRSEGRGAARGAMAGHATNIR
uniref:Secreted protein n=1 Tax=Macrostomum lignano TaxID=282301 RepID=A0A1I8FMP0_9PLAT